MLSWRHEWQKSKGPLFSLECVRPHPLGEDEEGEETQRWSVTTARERQNKKCQAIWGSAKTQHEVSKSFFDLMMKSISDLVHHGL